MSQLKVCRICLRTEAKTYHFNLYQLKCYYEEVTALKVNEEDGLPQHFCYECATILTKFHKFKEKCYYGQKLLKEMLWRGPITYEAIYKIDRKDTMLQSPVQVVTFTDHIKTYFTTDSQEVVNFDEDKIIEKIEANYFSDTSLTDGEDPVDFLHNEKIFEADIFDEKKKLDKDTTVEENAEKIETEVLKDLEPIFSPKAVYVDSEKGLIDVKCENLKNKKDKNSKNWIKSLHKVLDENNWKIYVLTEEEALKNFRARAEDTKYVNAPFKCKDCFKWFTKKDILNRHIMLRHVESLGSYECRFCRMRFKLGCYLRKHMRQHYTKFECLRCHLVCPLETSAVLHDEYHSGVTKKCTYCDEEFRHSSTYYTHLRTHRSEHVCTLCGASFVSKAGLKQHQRVKHIIVDIESPDDDEEVNTFCERCDIRFETRKAYEEHLFQSALHDDHEGISKTVNKKILGKKEQAKIAKRIRRRETVADVFSITTEPKPKKKMRRKHKKPTTCHQCGKHFNTQAECLKHHLAEHPRTSFFAPSERYICEICGSSLAPGSVANHQNMHTREKLFSCDTCGKQFHAIMGLKRHLVTHTGEKPYACNLCGKRFTQSNSMKLHYRTFHLKEPYPKRNRKKVKDLSKPQELEECMSESSACSLPDLPPPADLPHSQHDMHYLTLA
ncbi:zinc finger protein 846-like [Trichoplusia ni]|uniref:Zinc finger protein 846-like n=1 Tax=Trichoplusia ni TaxID=7111 RepID=A0A7E5VI86_TRINI|nr:zinc finger protein 846-like [Trichoplusia ni]